ncbi:MAG: RNA polymerase sigma-70 factor [Cytophagales bacterium]|nr:RNA polymerase sigma-70 factor [Cytophagales bacterium]
MDLHKEFVLIEQLKKGNQLAFNDLYNHYFPKLYGFSLKLTGNVSDAEEIVQEVFIKIWETRQNLASDLSLGSLLFTIAKNSIYNKARHRVYRLNYEIHVKHHHPGGVNLIDQQIAFNEVQVLINDAIKRMPEKRRAIFVMSRMEGLSNKEIAQKLNTSISNVENHIYKALKNIKAHMAKKKINVELISVLFLWLSF